MVTARSVRSISILATVVGVLVAAFVAIAFTATSEVAGEPTAGPAPVRTGYQPGPLAQAREDCWAYGKLTEAHDGRVTLVMEGVGVAIDEYEDATEEMASAVCVLERIDTPPDVIARIGNTRITDGTQDAEWREYTVTWSFHAGTGMNLTITEN